MARYEVHMEKYEMFNRDAENEATSYPSRIEAYFSSAFHLIEACAARRNVHIHKHQRVRAILEENPGVFGGKTDAVWRSFQKIENQIRPGQIYGGKIDGKALERTRKLFEEIEEICLERM
jgi:hypothetical protein